MVSNMLSLPVKPHKVILKVTFPIVNVNLEKLKYIIFSRHIIANIYGDLS